MHDKLRLQHCLVACCSRACWRGAWVLLLRRLLGDHDHLCSA